MEWKNILETLTDCANFYYTPEKEISISPDTTDEEFGDMYDFFDIEYIEILKPIPQYVIDYLHTEVGAFIPSSVGYYHFDWDDDEGFTWVKIKNLSKFREFFNRRNETV